MSETEKLEIYEAPNPVVCAYCGLHIAAMQTSEFNDRERRVGLTFTFTHSDISEFRAEMGTDETFSCPNNAAVWTWKHGEGFKRL